MCRLFLAAALLWTACAVGAAESIPSGEEREVEALSALADAVHSPVRDTNTSQRLMRGESINQAFVILTGEAVNPLLGVTALGMYNYFRTDEAMRDRLPLHDQPAVWVPLLVIIALMLFNSTLCEAVPLLKIPLNALGDVVNKLGAAAMLPLVVKIFADSVAQPAAGSLTAAAGFLFPAAYAMEAGAAGSAWHAAGWLLGAACGTVIYLAVWMTFNVIDVLILVCPFPGVDAVLKSLRLSAAGLLAASYHVSPLLAAALAAGIAVFSFLAAGWSFRLSVFGWIFSTDIILRRSGSVAAASVPAFAAAGLYAAHGVPMRTLGRLEQEPDGRLIFAYRPWLVLRRRKANLGSSGEYACGTGLMNPFLVRAGTPDEPVLRLPPRFCGKEKDLVSVFGLRGETACGRSGSLRVWFREQFGSRKTPLAET